MRSIHLLPDHDEFIREQGAQAFPHECCGFMLGHDIDDIRQIEKVIPATNIRGQEELHNRFTISPEAFMKADKAARAEKLDILGFYHSHPDAPPATARIYCGQQFYATGESEYRYRAISS